ncbi:MAG: D-cysteine desulfhydrase family protein [Bacillota bacterium]|nr:D-cysteine desulfhydrase family protein [Candidatus Fermentithermobacillaceae bacterium]
MTCNRRGYLDNFPRVNLGIWPTPLQRMGRIGQQLNHHNLFIKRDDLTGLGQGGNKTRSLEFLLGDARKRGADVILTAGGLQSNLCSLTAAACCKLGIECLLVHNDDKPDNPEGNMILNRILGAKSVFVGKVDEQQRTCEMEKIARELQAGGRKPYIIYNGASTPMGALGYVSAAFELFNQIQSQELDIRHVAIVGAMGGTASGLVLGTALLGHPYHVHVISVEYPKPVLHRLMDQLIEGASRIIQEVEGLEPITSPEDVMTIYDDYLGEGYAIPTQLSRRTLYEFARTEGILLEHVYTSKCVGGFLDLIQKGIIPPDEGACYIHTGGLASIFTSTIDTLLSWC